MIKQINFILLKFGNYWHSNKLCEVFIEAVEIIQFFTYEYLKTILN